MPDRPYPPQLVNDFAGILSADEQKRLERELVSYDDSSSTQIAVVTVKSLGDYAIEDWALEIGRKWGVGRKSKNNGVVILVSLEPRRINISPGYGLEGALPDITCKRIITNYITPKFKEGNFYTGLMDGIRAIRAAVKGEFKNEDYGKGDGDFPLWVFWLLLILLIIFIIVMMRARRHFEEYGTGRRRYRDSGGPVIWWGSGGGWSGGGGSWGGGDSDSGGGFGGFGGGDFGGGGASGDW